MIALPHTFFAPPNPSHCRRIIIEYEVGWASVIHLLPAFLSFYCVCPPHIIVFAFTSSWRFNLFVACAPRITFFFCRQLIQFPSHSNASHEFFILFLCRNLICYMILPARFAHSLASCVYVCACISLFSPYRPVCRLARLRSRAFRSFVAAAICWCSLRL